MSGLPSIKLVIKLRFLKNYTFWKLCPSYHDLSQTWCISPLLVLFNMLIVVKIVLAMNLL